jgi:hypothetical protein
MIFQADSPRQVITDAHKKAGQVSPSGFFDC